jgi:hypothetical protein
MARATASARRPRRCHRRQNRCRHKRNRHSRSRSGRTPCCPERGPRDNNRRNTRPPRHRPCRTRRPRNVCSSSSSRPCRCRPTCLRSAAPSARARPAAAASARPAAAVSARARPAAAASAPAPSLGSPNRRSCSRRRTRSVRRCPYPWRSSAARRSRRSGTATGGSYSCPRSCRSYRTRHFHSVCFCCRCRPPPAGGSPTLRCRAGGASWAASRPRAASGDLGGAARLPRARPLAAGAGAAVVRSLNLRQIMADLPFLRHRRLASRRPGPSRPQACRDDAGAAPR